MRLAAADSFNAVARISNAMTSSARLLAAPSETRIAWCWISSMPARALEFTILCATRTVETIGAEWSEFDLVGNIWTIPAHRMKAKRDHRIPLSSRAVQILELLPRDANSRLVFTRPGNQAHLSNGAMLRTPGSDGARGRYDPRLPVDVQGLGQRANELRAGSGRNGAGARRARQGRSRL
jgi:hypothetical protein